MLVLGVETSCDETAAAVVKDGHTLLSDVVSSQIDIHRRWGGIVPEVASRSHVTQLFPVIDQALSDARVSFAEIEVIGATCGPGLLGALLVGAQAAKALAMARNKPFVAVNHLEGHLLAIRLTERWPEPPFLGLIVSGGHTSLYASRQPSRYELIGRTRDDAAGEAFDKVARLLGLPYPGGAEIDRLAQGGDPTAIRFPRALSHPEIADWSFSGLKTAVSMYLKKEGVPTGQKLSDLCASFQEAIADPLSKKTIAAARRFGVRSLVLCGGVAANSRLRSLFQERAAERDIEVFIPPPRLCTDNGAMIAAAAHQRFELGLRSPLSTNPNPTWQLEAS